MAVVDVAQPKQPDVSAVTGGGRFLRAVIRNRKATVGALILLVMVFVAVPMFMAMHQNDCADHVNDQAEASDSYRFVEVDG